MTILDITLDIIEVALIVKNMIETRLRLFGHAKRIHVGVVVRRVYQMESNH